MLGTWKEETAQLKWFCLGPQLYYLPVHKKTPDSNCTNQILSQKLKNINIDDKLVGLKPMIATAQKKYPWALCPPAVPGGALVPVLLSFPRPRWSAPPLNLQVLPRASNTFYHQTFPTILFFPCLIGLDLLEIKEI